MIAAQTVAFRKGRCRSELLEASSRAEQSVYDTDSMDRGAAWRMAEE